MQRNQLAISGQLSAVSSWWLAAGEDVENGNLEMGRGARNSLG